LGFFFFASGDSRDNDPYDKRRNKLRREPSEHLDEHHSHKGGIRGFAGQYEQSVHVVTIVSYASARLVELPPGLAGW
jgi:hypothetical protein